MAPDLARFHGALLHRTEWRALGVHSRALASKRFVTVFPGYLTLAEHPASFNAMAHVLQVRVRPGSVLSHSTAAVLWDLPLPAKFENGVGLLRVPVLDVDDGEGGTRTTEPQREDQVTRLRRLELERGDGTVLVPAVRPGLSVGGSVTLPSLHIRVGPSASSSVGRGATVHRGEPGPAVQLGGLTVSARAETVRELATLLPLWDVVAIADALIGPGLSHGAETLESLQATLEAGRGTVGTARARRALALARTDVRSPAESVMRLLVEEVGLPPATPNLPVRDPDTGKTRYVDLAWPSIRFGLEYDGDGHRRERGRWQKDEERRDELAAQGWTLARATGADLRKPLRVLFRLRTALDQHGLEVPSAEHIRRIVKRIATNPPSLRIDKDGMDRRGG
jgi:hypothetical protein